MIRILAKLFIKNPDDTTSAQTRSAYGVLSGCVGIVLNLLLFAAKMTAGLIANAISLRADAFNNLGDAGSSIIALMGYRLAAKKPDRDHPYGHGRFEYIAGLLVSVAILLMGFSLLKDALHALIYGGEPAYLNHFWLSCGVMFGSILVKLYMFAYNRALSIKLQTQTLKAVSIDSISDMIATGVVLICALISHFAALPQWLRLDAVCGILVSLFILYSGYRSMRETVTPLLGMRPDPALKKEIEQAVLSFEGIYGVHDLIIHDYGPGRLFVSIHAEVSDHADILEIHDVIDNAEKYLSERFRCSATIHMDPVKTDDPATDLMKRKVAGILRTIDPRITLHDFRIAAGPTHTNLIFDAVLPYDFSVPEDTVRNDVESAVQAISPQYHTIIEFDRSDPEESEQTGETV